MSVAETAAWFMLGVAAFVGATAAVAGVVAIWRRRR